MLSAVAGSASKWDGRRREEASWQDRCPRGEFPKRGCLSHTLIEVKHRNIVRCLGYSSETQHVRAPYQGRFVWADLRQRLFCFEYLSKGSLADCLTGNIDQSSQTSHLSYIANVLSTAIYTFSWLVSVLRFASFCCASDYIFRFSLFLNFSKYLKSRRYLNQSFFIQRVIKLTSSEYPFNNAKKDSLLTTRFISVFLFNYSNVS